MQNAKVKLNKYGFYSVADLPSGEQLAKYYADSYYQETKGAYQRTYLDDEISLIRNKLAEKHYIAGMFMDKITSFLDIGCGEGWALKYFKEKEISVTGIDFSQYGCSQFNPDCLKDVLIGDIYEKLELLNKEKKKFDIILLGNLLEHVIDPLQLLIKCNSLISDGGVLIVAVPNDFSILQKYLLDKGQVDSEYWIALPDHLSYFNKEGLSNIAADANWRLLDLITDYPIDFALLNENTNYIRDKGKGKSIHFQRVLIENLFYSTSMELTVNYYRSLASLGFGRQIIAFFGKGL